MDSRYFAYLYSRKTKGSIMKKSLILEMCRQKVVDEIIKKEYSNKKKAGFGFLEKIEVVGFKEYDDHCCVIFKIHPDKSDIYIESIYKIKTGKINNTLYVSAGKVKEWIFK